MTRLKNAAIMIMASIVSLVCIGFFASFGLAVLGMFALLGLFGAVIAGIAKMVGPKPQTINV